MGKLKFKGTKGPWKMYPEDNGYSVSGDGWEDFAFINRIEGFEESVEFHQQAESNAKLITAAPLLLEALQEIIHLHMCEQEGLESGKPTFKMWFNAVSKGSAAIRKALE